MAVYVWWLLTKITAQTTAVSVICGLLQLISGQYVCQSNLSGSPQVELEMIGIPVDCAKHRSRIIPRNAVNPLWQEEFTFQVCCGACYLRTLYF